MDSDRSESSSGKFTTIDEYIAAAPEAARERLQTLRETIQAASPDAKEVISYNMPAFYLNGNVVYFAAAKSHIGLYPASFAQIDKIEGVSTYKKSKGTLHFPNDQPLPLELVRQIVEVRTQENLAKKKKK